MEILRFLCEILRNPKILKRNLREIHVKYKLNTRLQWRMFQNFPFGSDQVSSEHVGSHVFLLKDPAGSGKRVDRMLQDHVGSLPTQSASDSVSQASGQNRSGSDRFCLGIRRFPVQSDSGFDRFLSDLPVRINDLGP